MSRAPRKKQIKPGGEGDQPAFVAKELSERIFLYLQPKAINYPDKEDVTAEIELEHPSIVITMLNDHYTPRNIIHVDEFKNETPTFSVTIKQDNIEDVNSISDTPLTLTLYENIRHPLPPRDEEEYNREGGEEEEEDLVITERRPVAQGYIDLLEFFTKQRSRSSHTTFLYPLPSAEDHLTCKIEWEIYSLHPLIKNLIISNVATLTLGSLYNLEVNILDNCEDMMVNLSFLSTIPSESNKYDKIFICSYKGFFKEIICEQTCNYKWENLKNTTIGNLHSMGVNTDLRLNMHKLFQNHLAADGVEFKFEEIDINTESAVICNSLHRFILTDQMEKILDSSLAFNQQRMLIELIYEREPNLVLLQGTVDLNVFMYPGVSNCSFAIEMRPPGYTKSTLPTPKDNLSKRNKNTKGKDSASTKFEQISKDTEAQLKEKIPFATFRICLVKPITDPWQDLVHIKKYEIKRKIFNECLSIKQRPQPRKLSDECELNYSQFDDAIESIVDYMLRNQIKTVADNRQVYCSQLGNISNIILRLVACDFNQRKKTETNLEFTNLMTLVYYELEQRMYRILLKCGSANLEDCITTTEADHLKIITSFRIIKLMYEVGNLEMAIFFMKKLSTEFPSSYKLVFYQFLYNLEREDFEAAKLYLEKPIKEKYVEGEQCIDMVVLYISYKQDSTDPITAERAVENLLHSLTKLCLANPQDISFWILFYCLYKKHKYLPGMEYCRWKYENLYIVTTMNMPHIPISRWNIYMAHKLEFKSLKGQHFYMIVNYLLCLGLYEFAELIFDEIANEAMEVEKYFVYNTFKIVLNSKLPAKFAVKTFPVEKFLNAAYLRATLSQVNGNLEYFRNPSNPASMKQYSILCDLKDLDNQQSKDFHLGLFRYAYRMMEEKEFSKAKHAFSLCCTEGENCIPAAIGKGRACYKLDELNEAEYAFALSTRYGVHLANVFAYLAVINLRKGENFKALECWKYARLNPNEDVHMEVLNELNKISYHDIDLFIDIPEKKPN